MTNPPGQVAAEQRVSDGLCYDPAARAIAQASMTARAHCSGTLLRQIMAGASTSPGSRVKARSKNCALETDIRARVPCSTRPWLESRDPLRRGLALAPPDEDPRTGDVNAPQFPTNFSPTPTPAPTLNSHATGSILPQRSPMAQAVSMERRPFQSGRSRVTFSLEHDFSHEGVRHDRCSSWAMVNDLRYNPR